MKIGLVNGCYDLLHEGHYHFLANAKNHCDYLIVAVNSDESVRRLKGEGRPREPWAVRMENVMETGLVDAVIPFDGFVGSLLVAIRPDVYIRGYDQGIDPTMGSPQIAAGIQCELVHVSELPGHSTSLQIERQQVRRDVQ